MMKVAFFFLRKQSFFRAILPEDPVTDVENFQWKGAALLVCSCEYACVCVSVGVFVYPILLQLLF